MCMCWSLLCSSCVNSNSKVSIEHTFCIASLKSDGRYTTSNLLLFLHIMPIAIDAFLPVWLEGRHAQSRKIHASVLDNIWRLWEGRQCLQTSSLPHGVSEVKRGDIRKVLDQVYDRSEASFLILAVESIRWMLRCCVQGSRNLGSYTPF